MHMIRNHNRPFAPKITDPTAGTGAHAKSSVIKQVFRLVPTVIALAIGLQAAAVEAAVFDLNTGNAATQGVIPSVTPPLQATWAPGDASLIFRVVAMLGNGWFDAIAPYHPTAVGIYSNLGRRPATERANNYQRNVAMLYASQHILNSVLPNHKATWQKMLTDVGLDPNDQSTDPATPAGIGNLAGAAVVAQRANDGMNQLGNEGGCIYNCQPYADYTGFQPVNNAYEVLDPSGWQPRIAASRNSNGIFTVQHFVTPQYRLAKPYSYTDPSIFTVPAPVSYTDFIAYKQQADEVLAASASLTDELKMKVEFFDNKFVGFGGSISGAAMINGLQRDLDRYVHYHFLTNMAAFDVGIAVWQEKAKYNAVRPFTAIRVLYGDSPVTSWGGTQMGTVSNMPASQWKEYLNVANHPEYPSGSATFCAAIAQASRLYFGTDSFGLSRTFRKGSSVIEPGFTPTVDVTFTFPTWTQWAEDCGQSRINGGVHFQQAVDVAPMLGDPIGTAAYDFLMRHINGNP
jgi:hypothetical protein